MLGASCALLLLTACGNGSDSDRGDSGEGWKPPVGTAQAEQVARRTALTPRQWGKDFQRRDGNYEYDLSEISMGRPDEDCRWQQAPGPSPDLVGWVRNVEAPGSGPSGSITGEADSMVLVHKRQSTARLQLPDMRAALDQCQTWYYGDVLRYDDIHMDNAGIDGVDEILAWSATSSQTAQGQKAPREAWPVSEIMARKGPVVLHARITADPDAYSAQALRIRAARAMETMVAHLTSEE